MDVIIGSISFGVELFMNIFFSSKSISIITAISIISNSVLFGLLTWHNIRRARRIIAREIKKRNIIADFYNPKQVKEYRYANILKSFIYYRFLRTVEPDCKTIFKDFLINSPKNLTPEMKLLQEKMDSHLSRWLKLEPTETTLADTKHISEKAQYKYYEYLREEVKREDEITHQRLTWMITFQGFMIAAVTTMICFAWPAMPPKPEFRLSQAERAETFAFASPQKVTTIRKISLGAIPIIGLVIAHTALIGIMAARRSLSNALIPRNWTVHNWSFPR